MNRQIIQQRLDEIQELAITQRDYEAAHSKEDQLYYDFIRHIASMGGPYAERALQVLQSRAIAFERPCA